MATITGIYRITNTLNGKCYIGQSVNIHRRWQAHKSLRKKGASAITDALKSLGIDMFAFEVLEECSRDELNNKEVYWITTLNTIVPNGYNLNSGGKCPTFTHDSTKQKQRQAKLGTKQSEETKAKRLEKLLLIRGTPEYRKKLSDARKKYKQSEETIRKRADAQKGKEVSLEQRINIARAHMKGKVIKCSNGETYLSTKEAAIACNLHTDSVLRVCNGKYKQTKGFTFWYEEAA